MYLSSSGRRSSTRTILYIFPSVSLSVLNVESVLGVRWPGRALSKILRIPVSWQAAVVNDITIWISSLFVGGCQFRFVWKVKWNFSRSGISGLISFKGIYALFNTQPPHDINAQQTKARWDVWTQQRTLPVWTCKRLLCCNCRSILCYTGGWCSQNKHVKEWNLRVSGSGWWKK